MKLQRRMFSAGTQYVRGLTVSMSAYDSLRDRQENKDELRIRQIGLAAQRLMREHRPKVGLLQSISKSPKPRRR